MRTGGGGRGPPPGLDGPEASRDGAIADSAGHGCPGRHGGPDHPGPGPEDGHGLGHDPEGRTCAAGRETLTDGHSSEESICPVTGTELCPEKKTDDLERRTDGP